MQHIITLFTSKAGLLSLLAGLSGLLQLVYPVLPNPWAGLVTAILAVLAYYHVGKAVSAGRAAGVRGI